MLPSAKRLVALAVGGRQAVQQFAGVCARYSVSSREVSEANQELDDFFGVVHTSSTAAFPQPRAPGRDDAAGPGPSSVSATLNRFNASTNASAAPRTQSAAAPAGHTAAHASHAAGSSGPAAELTPFSSYVGGGASATQSDYPLRPQQPPPSLSPHSSPSTATAFPRGHAGADDGAGSDASAQRRLTHIDASGSASMVDVSEKAVTTREAQASCLVSLGSAFPLVASNSLAKGDVLKVAQLAGISGAKATSSLIPLCHNIPISKVDVQLQLQPASQSVLIRSLARTDGKTGVEMEALTAASVAALTVYDMVKAAAVDVVVGPLQLDYKAGGRSGTYLRAGLRRADLLPSAKPPL